MEACVLDVGLYYRHLYGIVKRLCATYVEDSSNTETGEYSKLCEESKENFKCQTRRRDIVPFGNPNWETKDWILFETHQLQKKIEPSYLQSWIRRISFIESTTCMVKQYQTCNILLYGYIGSGDRVSVYKSGVDYIKRSIQ